MGTWKPWSMRKDTCSSLISNIGRPHSPEYILGAYCMAQTVDYESTSRMDVAMAAGWRWRWLDGGWSPQKVEQSHVGVQLLSRFTNVRVR